MTHLPKHPFTGLAALGLRRDGRPIWPVLGGSGENPPAPVNPPAPTPPPAPPNPTDPPADPDDKPLGPNGEKALAAERKAREAVEKELAALAPLKKLAEALGGGKTGDGKTEVQQLTERFEQQQKDLETERAARFRSDVAVEKKLTPGQASLLAGTTREEISAHADKLIAEFGGKTADPDPGRRGGMRPDPAQGARPGGKPTGKEAGLAEAQRRFKKT